MVSQIGEKDRHDILIQQIIDDLARRSRGRHPHEDVVAELAELIAAENLPAKPRPWLDAVAASAISRNAYVVSATTLVASDVPEPSTNRSDETIE